MLTTLRIRNLVTIEDLTVDLGPGLSVLTGETGAGKSILVDALGLAAGSRGDSQLVRSGARSTVVEAAFTLDHDPAARAVASERGVEASDGELVVRREVGASGIGRVLLNGSPATVAVLKEIGEHLVETHGQHEHRGLLDPARHLELLDAFGAHEPLVAAVRAACRGVEEAEGCLARLEASTRDASSRSDALSAVVREIGQIDPKPGELARLGSSRAVLQNAAKVAELLGGALERIDEGDASALAALAGAQRRVDDLAAIDPALEPLAARLTSARIEIADVCAGLSAYRDGASFDPDRLEAIETRRAAIERLLLRFGPAEEDVQAAAAEAARELATIGRLDAEIEQAARAAEVARAAYARAATALTAARGAAAKRLGPAVAAELKPLALSRAIFSVALTPAAGDGPIPLSPSGAERAEFLLAANPGEPARPLGRAASGGELSRVMLALHVVLEGERSGRTLVFDEVDAGVSGAVAQAVGARLARLARRRQVLCVTHLPQVAAFADGHYHVGKRVLAGRTHTEIVRIDGDSRVDELARMLGGRQAGSAARENAMELLAEAGRADGVRGRA